MTSQTLKKIRELDVFCLMVFKVIFQTGHANIAAKQLNVSAPKISRCLNMLRATFNDELFYRRQLGLKPTPLAESLFEPICQFCDSVLKIEQSMADKGLEHTRDSLKIAVTPSIMASLSLTYARSNERTNIGRVQFILWDSDSADLIHNGEVDLGVAFDPCDDHVLCSEPVASLSHICIAANEEHDIWLVPDGVTLEEVCKYPFLCLNSKGFNDKLDPLEVFARQSGIEIKNIERVGSRDEWYSNILTMHSLAFLSCSEAAICGSLPGIKVMPLSDAEVARLHGESMAPQYLLIEAPEDYRRYSNDQRSLFIQLIKQLVSKS
ncbi:LysR family transcriptional regulator [Shewanella colwelliana]|uniref:LysR family transcriptional regulator n=1 Tax=Shewanella colwelliana TaxID=23 RepID=A0A1E5IQ63_SHECO|nr:LysR family transcriptional regulator [Shewanella colwelliana]OEG72666.1 LysR family transcriptional regulator [Shewanella colwelliana]